MIDYEYYYRIKAMLCTALSASALIYTTKNTKIILWLIMKIKSKLNCINII